MIRLKVDVTADTPEEVWSRLLILITEACESKQLHGEWPVSVWHGERAWKGEIKAVTE